MNPAATLFKSKLGWRFFIMFVSCALVPFLVLALTSYFRVTGQLRNQAFDRLWQASKTHGLSITEHLLLADEQLKLVQSILEENTGSSLASIPPAVVERNQSLFTGLAVVHGDEVITSWGECRSEFWHKFILAWNRSDQKYLRLTQVNDGSSWPRVVLIRTGGAEQNQRDALIGVVNHAFLWGLENGSVLPPATEFCVWDAQGHPLFSSLGAADGLHRLKVAQEGGMPSGLTEFDILNRHFMAAFWSPFLKAHFQSPPWTIAVMEDESHILEPVHYFRVVFPLIVLLMLGIVILLSIRTIRANLTPIDALMDGARQVARRRFDHRVIVTSRDEFQELATAFNRMTNQLDVKFKELRARAELDRTILSVQDLDQIVAVFLDHIRQYLPHRITAVSIAASDGQLGGRSFIQIKESPQTNSTTEPFYLLDHERDFFKAHPKWARIDANRDAPGYLHAMMRSDVGFFLVLPIWLDDRLFALVSLGMTPDQPLSEGDFVSFRNVADHLAVGFTNCGLIAALKELNWGTLQALARTVDAKSSWTAGHSVRVTQVAVSIAKAMGLDAKAQEDIKQAGYLHDIGKIAIPISILDKNGKLTEEEYQRIKEHPSMGARILSPIRAYADLIPIVDQHHERFDGRGYPHGLRQSEIHPLARIMAVADAFDAMVSDRPYRKGLSMDKAIEIISLEAGKQFDPKVVAAFIRILEKKIEWMEGYMEMTAEAARESQSVNAATSDRPMTASGER